LPQRGIRAPAHPYPTCKRSVIFLYGLQAENGPMQ
jgi:hypothetical protein